MRVYRGSNFSLYVYPGDHAPPHFHIVGPNSRAQIRIDTLQIMRGEIARSDYAEAVAWAAGKVEMLLETWRDLNERD